MMRKRMSIAAGVTYLGRGGKLRRVEGFVRDQGMGSQEVSLFYSVPDGTGRGRWVNAGHCTLATFRQWALREAVAEEIAA